MNRAARVDVFFDETFSDPRWVAKVFCSEDPVTEVFLQGEGAEDPNLPTEDLLPLLENSLIKEDLYMTEDTYTYIFPAGRYKNYLKYL